MLPETVILNMKLPVTQLLPDTVARTLKKISMKVSVPKPSIHFSLVIILAGPDLRNLATPNEAVNVESTNVQMKRGPSLKTPGRDKYMRM